MEIAKTSTPSWLLFSTRSGSKRFLYSLTRRAILIPMSLHHPSSTTSSLLSRRATISFGWTPPEVAPFAFLLSPLRDKQALVIRADNSTLTTTPDSMSSDVLQTFRIQAKLTDSGTLEGKVDRTLQGDDQEVLLRAAFRTVPMPQWKDLIQRISYSTGFAGDVSDVTASTPEKIDEAFHFSYNYTRKEYPDWSNGRISSPLPPIVLPAAPDSHDKLSHHISFDLPSKIYLVLLVQLPYGYDPELP